MVDAVARAIALRAPVAVTEDQLLGYIDRGEQAIRISGGISLSASRAIPHDVGLFGFGGRYNDGADEMEGDYLVGDVAGPLVDLPYRNSLVGLGIRNVNSGGSAIRDQQGEHWLQNLAIVFTGTGVLMQDPQGSSGLSETKFSSCRLTGGHKLGTPVLTSEAIVNHDHTDTEVNQCIIRWANVGIRDYKGTFTVRESHLYCGAPSNQGAADFITESTNPGAITLLANYFEGYALELVKFQHFGWIDQVIANRFSAPGGSATTALFHWDNTTLGYGALHQFKMVHNTLYGIGSNVAVGIKQTSITNAADGDVGDNIFTNVTTESQLRTRDSGHTTATGNGSATTFTIPHGLFTTERNVAAIVTPMTAAAAGFDYVTTDGTNITVHYASAPANGASLAWAWQARNY